MAATSAIGTFIKKTEPHQKRASSAPPTIGPRAKPTPLVPAQIAIAFWRCAVSRNTSVMIESVEVIMSAAPMPMAARAAISIPTDPENAAQADPAAKASTPIRKVHLRPNLSARLPATSTKPPKTRA